MSRTSKSDSELSASPAKSRAIYRLTAEQIETAKREYPRSPKPSTLALLLAEGIDPKRVPAQNAFFADGYIQITNGIPQLHKWPSDAFRETVLEVSAIEDAMDYANWDGPEENDGTVSDG